jgi:peptidyl-tRNA hydrolase
VALRTATLPNVPLLFAGAQCAHAAIGVVLQLLAADVSLYQRWEQCGQRKIVVKVQDAQCLVRGQPKHNSSTSCCTNAAANRWQLQIKAVVTLHMTFMDE